MMLLPTCINTVKYYYFCLKHIIILKYNYHIIDVSRSTQFNEDVWHICNPVRDFIPWLCVDPLDYWDIWGVIIGHGVIIGD